MKDIEPRTFPIYLLRFDGEWEIVFPGDDIGHADFWEQTVSFLVAERFGIPQKKLENLPYCQRRARIVEPDIIYYGGKPDPDLLKAIRMAVGNTSLEFCHDDHERRLREDVSQFKRLVHRYAVSGS